MKAPENLVNAVNRLNPRAILVLDANVLMTAPRVVKYEIAAQGQFLLVVPEVVITEIANIKRGGQSKGNIRKAACALNVMDELFDRGQPTDGIDIGEGRWMITTKTPKPKASEDTPLEERQVQRTFGNADAAILRLAEVCKEHFPDAPTLLVTHDRDLMRTARSRGLHACKLAALRSAETLSQMLIDRSLIDIPVSALVAELSDPDEERPVRITVTLEELRSEGDNLVSRGVGSLTYDNGRYPFRWTFPYKNAAKVEDFESLWDLADSVVMPLENVDFMGADERLPEQVRRYVCSMLESLAHTGFDYGELHVPHVRIYLDLSFLMGMEGWGPFPKWDQLGEVRELLKSQSEIDTYNAFANLHNQHRQTLLDGTCDHFGHTFIKAFEHRKELDSMLGEEERAGGALDELAPALAMLLDTALNTWFVGDTREAEFVYHPFAWPQEAEESQEEDDEEHEDEYLDEDEEEIDD